MQTVVFSGKEQIDVEDRPVPTPGRGEVLIKVKRAGICGTDMSIVAGLHPRAKPSLVMGHEFVGHIASLGPDVPAALQLGEGDRVVVEPLISCGRCYACKAGFAHVCQHLGLYGIDADGGFAEYVKVAADKAFKVPGNLSDTTAAMIEPLAVAVHSVRLSSLNIGDTACVLGGGPIGLLTALVAKETAAKDLLLVERQPFRIEMARRFGLDVFDSSQGDIREAVLERTGGRGVNTVFEAAGAPPTILVAPKLCCVRGEIIQISMPKVPREMDIVAITFYELTLKGVRVYDGHDFARAIRLAATWEHDLDRIASAPFDLADAPRAFDVARKGEDALKVLFRVSS